LGLAANSTPIVNSFDYVEDVIKMLKMEEFAEAIVGVPGEGLNVEQRKLLTIGVELAAKPKLLLNSSIFNILITSST
jgi:ATP-binding cassette subfamily G (WHITE) protein 2 (PDR)